MATSNDNNRQDKGGIRKPNGIGTLQETSLHASLKGVVFPTG
jgi:hypothetical protein